MVCDTELENKLGTRRAAKCGATGVKPRDVAGGHNFLKRKRKILRGGDTE